MTDVQVVMTSLLSELNQIFTKKRISYCLGDRLAWDAVKFHKFHDSTIEAVVLVDGSCRAKVADALDNIENRVYCEDGEQIAYYVATNTTLIDLRFPLKPIPGIAVSIKYVDADRYLGPAGEPYDFGFKVFRGLSRASFEGMQFPVPNPDKYFSSLVSENWQKEKWPYRVIREATEVIIDLHIGAEKFIDAAAKAHIDIDDVSTQWQALYAWDKSVLKSAKKAVTTNDDKLEWTVQRYRIALDLAPHKDRILSFWNRGEKEVVQRALRDYIDAILSFYKKKGIAMCVDPDLFRVAVEIISSQSGMEKYAELLPAAVPAEYSATLIDDLAPYLG